MPGTPPTSPRHGAPRFASSDPDQVATDLNAVVDRFDITAPRFESGPLVSRPSTGVGIADRYYFATDDTSGGPSGTLWRDAGGASPTWQRLTPANAEAAFSAYKPFPVTSAALPGSGSVTAAGTFLMAPGVGGPTAVGAATTGAYSFPLAAADYAAGSRTTMMRIRWELAIGAVAPGITLSPGLYPVATYAAASGVQMSIATVGTVVTGSTVTYATPAANSNLGQVSADFAMPASGDYVLGFAVSGGMAAGSQGTLRAQVQYRQV